VNSCIGAMTFCSFSSWASWSDNLLIAFIVKFLDKSLKMLSVAVLDPLKILVRKLTELFGLYIANGVSNSCLLLCLSRSLIFISSQMINSFFFYIKSIQNRVLFPQEVVIILRRWTIDSYNEYINYFTLMTHNSRSFSLQILCVGIVLKSMDSCTSICTPLFFFILMPTKFGTKFIIFGWHHIYFQIFEVMLGCT
jgi:hypothetical protein